MHDRGSILLVEDEKILRVSLRDALSDEGYTVWEVEDGASALAALTDGAFSLVLTDVRLPDVTGMEILKEAKRIDPACPVLVMTAFGTIKDAVEAMRIGAFDYITKPFELEVMLKAVARALEMASLTSENIRLKKELSSRFQAVNIIGEGREMKALYALLDRVSRTDSTVLIRGESGTGKELVASTIHYQSSRKEKPIVRVNCAALPADLIESELFGYEKGAFTGADSRKLGRFELADGGTIFLDEIGDLPLLTQTKILRVLEQRSLERLGGTHTVPVDVRVISATHVNLEQAVEEGRFRKDLYYRLNVIPIELPPLRRRRSDIPLLIQAFSKRFNDQFGTGNRFTAEAVAMLLKYNFPGNVRELLNIIERCFALASEPEIGPEHLPDHIRRSSDTRTPLLPLKNVVEDSEKSHILGILKLTKGNRTKAARILGISRKTLWEKISHLKIESAD